MYKDNLNCKLLRYISESEYECIVMLNDIAF